MDIRWGRWRLRSYKWMLALQVSDGWKPPCFYDIASVHVNPRFLSKGWKDEQQRNASRQKVVGLKGAGNV